MSNGRSTSPTRHDNTNPTTPLSPFPSTPHRLSYIDKNNNNPITSNYYDNPLLAEHVSPTKALVATRLNHEITTLTSWLEQLFAPDAVPLRFLKWRDEVFAAAASGQSGFDGSLVGGFDHGIATPHTPGRSNRAVFGVGTETANGNDVLEALNALKQMNLSADHLASLIHGSRSEELRSLEAVQNDMKRQRDDGIGARSVLDGIYTRLSPEAVDSLASMSEAAIMLGLDPSGERCNGNSDVVAGHLTASFSQVILEQAQRKLVIEEQIRELGTLRGHMRSRSNENSSLGVRAGAGEIKEDGHHDEQVNAKTAQFNRDTKQINLKIMEYHDRATGLQRQLAILRSRSNISLGDVLEARARVEDRKLRVRALQERFAAFNGLPPDLEDSRDEVRRATTELESLKRRRERLFERMGTG